MFGNIHEECGVFGVYSNKTRDVASLTYLSLYALQHRGQESCGIVVNDDGVFNYHKDLGLVNQVFDKDILDKLGTGNISIGHVRYSTAEQSNTINSQPLVVRHIKGTLAIAQNGVLTNASELREEFENKGMIFQSNNDTEIMSYSIIQERLTAPSIQTAVERAMSKLKGAYAIVIMSPTKLIACRDPHGMKPLCLGKIDDGYVVASESCALDSIGAEFIRDLLPGEIIVIDKNGIESIKTHCGEKSHLCVFEYVYFARPDSVIEGSSVHVARKRAGKYLWREHPVDADIVIGVPDSGLDAALGFAQESGIPYGIGFIKNRYIGRTFIQPTQAERINAVKIKLNAVANTVKGKRVVMIDDSIVRGTTCGIIVKLLREAGASEVHVRISSPPFIAPCYFGTDIDAKDKLIACQMSLDEVRKFIGADTLGYLSLESVKKLAGNSDCDFCIGCFNEQYPIPVPADEPKNRYETKISEK